MLLNKVNKENLDFNNPKDVLSFLLRHNVLVGPDFASSLLNGSIVVNEFVINRILDSSFDVLTIDVFNQIVSGKNNMNNIIDSPDFVFDDNNPDLKRGFSDHDFSVKILSSYSERPKKKDFNDFLRYYSSRYEQLSSMLRSRSGLKNLMSVNRVLKKRDRSEVSIIGLVSDKSLTKSYLRFVVEDPTGSVSVIIRQSNKDLFEKAKGVVLDSVIGVNGVCGNNTIFANDIILPDIPNRDLKKSPDDVYAIFISDLHVGSLKFLPNDFNRFLDWINGNLGSEKHREIASKVKYVFIAGDLVDGVGIYRGQDEELSIKDIHKQYEKVAELLSRIPKDKALIIIPGNHDAVRIAEPQPPLYKDFSSAIHELPNAFLLSNPSWINIHSQQGFSGFDVLMYHGYSFDHYVANVDEIRKLGGYDRPDIIMKFLLRLRHLAPTHASTLFSPEYDHDPLVINRVPDFFITGHIHKTAITNYKGVTLVSGSCWQARTKFQEKVGHHPEPSRVPIVNLKTRKYKVLKFSN